MDNTTSNPFSILKNVSSSGFSGLSGAVQKNGVLFSPNVGNSKTKPSTPLDSKAANSDIENENPNPSRKKKNRDSGSYNIKAKRLKKLSKDLPDIGGVDGKFSVENRKQVDILNMQEDLGKQREQIKNLEAKDAEQLVRISSLEAERNELSKARDSIKVLLEDSQNSKDILLLEIASKTKQNMEIIEEKKQILKDLSEEREKVLFDQEILLTSKSKRLDDEIVQLKEQLLTKQQQIDSLTASLNENYVEIRMKQQLFDHAKELEQKAVEQVNDLSSLNKELQSKLQKEYETYNSSFAQMESQMSGLRQEYFISTALAIKLHLTSASIHFNKTTEIRDLFEKAREDKIPLQDWPKWITKQLLR